jgi:hypothetical protein
MIFYLLFAIFFKTDFHQQMIFLLRLAFALQISAYIMQTHYHPFFLYDTKVLHSYTVYKNVYYFLVFFYHTLAQISNDLRHLPTPKKNSENFIHQLMSHVRQIWLSAIEKRNELCSVDDFSFDVSHRRPIFHRANFYLLVMVATYLTAYFIMGKKPFL